MPKLVRPADVFRHAKARKATNDHTVLFQERNEFLSTFTDVHANKVCLRRENLEAKRTKFAIQVFKANSVVLAGRFDVSRIRKSSHSSHLSSLVHVNGSRQTAA